MDNDESTGRQHHLLDGRRVTVADLVEFGLVPAGTALTFTRLGETHRASVSDGGRIALADGREFSAPSRAAMESLGRRAGDGWYVWRLDDGRLLHDVREELLDRAAQSEYASAPESGEPRTDAQRRHAYLREARARAEAGDRVATTVRELIAKWGAKGRGHRVNQRIEADLDNHGLVTLPNFRKVTIDAIVELVTTSASEADVAAEEAPATSDEAEKELEVGLTVGNIESALGGLASVAPDAPLNEAITLMLLNDFSQLAVTSGSHTLRGAVTWKSITTARQVKPAAVLSDATVPASEARYDQDLFEILPVLADAEFVFVRDETNRLAGIVTTSDVALAYRELATPFLLIGEIDQLLRWLISRTFSLNDIVVCCDADGARDIDSAEDLTFGDYQRILESPSHWQKLGWPLDRNSFVKRLDEIRGMRNDIMHFNPDPLPPGSENMLRHFVKLLKGFIE
jgi:CBS domain-containing protein